MNKDADLVNPKEFLNNKFKELEAFLIINRNDLDWAISCHAAIYNEVAQITTELISKRDYAKQKIDEIFAEVSLEIRDLCKFNGEKTTEELIKQKTINDERVQEAEALFLEYKFLSEKWAALKEAFSTRGYMIRDLAGLIVAGHFAEITVSGKTQQDVEISNLREKLSKNRK